MLNQLDIFNYELLQEKIAQRPVYPYDSAKLLVLDRKGSSVEESVFSNISEFLFEDDILVFNNTSVIPARLFGSFADTGGKVELLLVKEINHNTWECLARPAKKLKIGREIIISDDLRIVIKERIEDVRVVVEFVNAKKENIYKNGNMPIPPYIRKGHSDDQDKIDYQTIFAKDEGSIAAPTASLHFTNSLMDKIKAKGVEVENVTLHVGAASFLPLWKEEDEELKEPGEELYKITKDLFDKLKKAKEDGRRIVAVGTTVVRAIETAARNEKVDTLEETKLFITPGFDFKFVDAMITNFHQPATTHIMLMQAFMGYDLLEKSYNYALENNFRFLSYGDGMLIS